MCSFSKRKKKSNSECKYIRFYIGNTYNKLWLQLLFPLHFEKIWGERKEEEEEEKEEERRKTNDGNFCEGNFLGSVHGKSNLLDHLLLHPQDFRQ